MNVSAVSKEDLAVMQFDVAANRAYLTAEGVKRWGGMHRALSNIRNARDKAKREAIKNLARYKFSNFGYHAARWVTLNAIIGDRQPNPFKAFVDLARKMN